MKRRVSLTMSMLCTATISCSGGSEGGDTTVARGGGNGTDDYGVEIPVATSLTVADFGYDSGTQLTNPTSDIQNIWADKDGAYGSISDIAYMSANSGSDVVAMIGPKPGESCQEFMDALPSRTEDWLCERRFYLPKSAFKTESDSTKLDLRFDRNDPRYNCTAVLAADALPDSKCYIGHGGSIAFVAEVRPDNPYGSSDDKDLRLWSNQAGSFNSQSLFTCLYGDSSCSQLQERKTHALNWMWDETTNQFRFLVGHSSELKVFETTHTEWANGQSSPMTVSAQATSATSGHLSGVAIQKVGEEIQRMAFVERSQNHPELYTKSGSGSWSLSLSTEFSSPDGAWKPQVAADGTVAWLDSLGNNEYRPRVENLFTMFAGGTAMSSNYSPIGCSSTIEASMVTAPMVGNLSDFIAGCRNLTRVDSSGESSSFVIDGTGGSWSHLDDEMVAISSHPDREPEVFYAWKHRIDSNGNPAREELAVELAKWTAEHGLVEMEITGERPGPGDLFQWNQKRISAMRAIQDSAGRSFVVFVVAGEGLDKAMYLGTPFPDNTLHIEKIAEAGASSNAMSLSNMILYRKD